MMTDDEKKEEAIRLVEDAESQAKTLEDLGQKIVASARLVRDVAGPFAKLFRSLPSNALSGGGWDRQIEDWKIWHEGVRRMQKLMPAFSAMTMASVNSTLANTSHFVFTGPMIQPGALEAFQAIAGWTEQHGLAEKAMDSMRRLGLDRRGGTGRPPLELLEEAKAAIDRPVVGDGGAVSVLISLRESLDATITELVRRRPEQEPARNWKDKVVSIGAKCGNASLPASHFEKIGNDAKALMDELSGAKQGAADRQHLKIMFSRGVVLLNALLESVDETRLRPS
jgi:hypothetical protein